MSKFTIEEATVLSTFVYEMEEDEYVLCHPKGVVDKHMGDVIAILLRKEVLFKDGLDEKCFWIRQNDYREVYDLTNGFAKDEAKDEAEKPTEVTWQDLVFVEYMHLITMEGLSMDAAREEMHIRVSKLLDNAQNHFLKLILNSKLSDL